MTTMPNQTLTPDEQLKHLKAKYEEADLRLFRLEEELDFLIYSSRVLRGRRTELFQGHLEYANSSPYRTTVGDQAGLIDEYLVVFQKNKSIDDAIISLKKECSDARNTCSSLFAKSHDPLVPVHGKTIQSLDEEIASGAEGSARIEELDDLGAMDREARAERLFETRRTILNVATVVGGLGASITFTTIFSATRGRLDLLSWSFTSYIFALFTAALFQGLQRPGSLGVKFFTRYAYTEMRKTAFISIGLLLILPLGAGTVLLILVVALLDPASKEVVPGSKIALHISAFLTLGWVGIWVLYGCIYGEIWKISRGRITALKTASDIENISDPTGPPKFPSHLLHPDHRWSQLPGGTDYTKYRIRRQKNINPSRQNNSGSRSD